MINTKWDDAIELVVQKRKNIVLSDFKGIYLMKESAKQFLQYMLSKGYITPSKTYGFNLINDTIIIEKQKKKQIPLYNFPTV